ncbi:MAG: polysaccharide biosynthesis/export family protein [Cyclobacteriaceae bacterium]|nr:MAG: polysaccharide biosynthesis/export family protein [Cyclobacteriaceae bacterium]
MLRFETMTVLRVFLFLALIIGASSCVTNKKFVLLQKEDMHNQEVLLDTTVRAYQPVSYDYLLQPEDIVYVRFESLTPTDYDFLNQNKNVSGQNFNLQQGSGLLIGDLLDQNGEIPFPFIGKVKLGGLTVFQAQDKLQQIAEQYLDKPVVKVRLINFRFTVLGEVNSEGTVTLSNNRVTMLEALGLAGGMTDLADRSKVKLIRQQNGELTVQYINLLDENFINSPYYYVHQNDVLLVPSLRQRPYRKYFGQNLSLVISSLSLLLITFTLINSTK